MNNIEWPWHIEKLPFYHGPLENSEPNEIPHFLPFTLDLEPDTGLLFQQYDEAISGVLNQAYEKGSIISGNVDEQGIGERYADSFLQFIKSKLQTELSGKRVLEIGCGTGYILYKLQQLGADVVGVEPGEHGISAGQKYNIPVIRDFFPTPQITGRFDVIILNNVLEHVSDYRRFLQQTSGFLAESGRLIITVPNCQPYIASGDISMLFHEHYSYFTKETLKNTVEKAVQRTLSVEESGFGGLLYSITDGEQCPGLAAIAADEVSRSYRQRAEGRMIPRLKEYFERYGEAEIGIFVAGRAMNILAILREEINLARIRFFDDDAKLHGRYLPGFANVIESREQLLSRTPQRILVMSFSFGEQIKNGLAEVLPAGQAIDTVAGVLANQ